VASSVPACKTGPSIDPSATKAAKVYMYVRECVCVWMGDMRCQTGSAFLITRTCTYLV
jgi:hypothetical protein